MKKYIGVIVLIMLIGLAKAQRTKVYSLYDDYVMTTIMVAKDMDNAFAIMDFLTKENYNNRKNLKYSIGILVKYNLSDTILELVRVDTCLGCNYEENYRWPQVYILNVNNALSFDTYRMLLDYARKISEINRYYTFKNFYIRLLNIIYGYYYYLIGNKLIPQAKIDEYKPFFNELGVRLIKEGLFSCFELDYFRDSCVTDEVIIAVKEHLKTPRYEHYEHFQQYMEDKKSEWDPRQIDTTGIPETYKDRNHLCWGNDTLCFKYTIIMSKFWYYYDYGQKLGVSPQEAMYRLEANYFEYCDYLGYKKLGYVINYAIKKQDIRLLPEIKEFIRKNPNFPLTKEQKEYIGVDKKEK